MQRTLQTDSDQVCTMDGDQGGTTDGDLGGATDGQGTVSGGQGTATGGQGGAADGQGTAVEHSSASSAAGADHGVAAGSSPRLGADAGFGHGATTVSAG